jgi:hypothetical protein
MSSYKIHEQVGEVVPWQAKYSYPTQASRAWKDVIKVAPKNGGSWTVKASGQGAGALVRFELPAQGYLNTRNTFLQFDVELISGVTGAGARFQNNIQTIFRRVRGLYGSLSLEDIRDYHALIRLLTEGTMANSNIDIDQTAITEGIGGNIMYGNNRAKVNSDFVAANSNVGNARLLGIQCSDAGPGLSVLPSGVAGGTRRYQVQLALGLFQQSKLLPLKWMASQVAIELELAAFNEAVAAFTSLTAATDYYTISNMYMLLELFEFDASYDQAFLEGLRGEGVPIKFSSWNTFINTPAPGPNQSILIPERNRSLKAIFTVQRPPSAVTGLKQADTSTDTVPTNVPWDSMAFVESSQNLDPAVAGGSESSGWVASYQFRIGGKYYPSQPVSGGSGAPNGGAEAFCEFAKAMNVVGDYRLNLGINPMRWTQVNGTAGQSTVSDWAGMQAYDNKFQIRQQGPTAFVISADLETSDGSEISGLNGEEQNDIALVINYGGSANQSNSAIFDTFVYYDALLVLRENNVVELIK